MPAKDQRFPTPCGPSTDQRNREHPVSGEGPVDGKASNKDDAPDVTQVTSVHLGGAYVMAMAALSLRTGTALNP